MDFRFTEQEEAFRQEVLEWVKQEIGDWRGMLDEGDRLGSSWDKNVKMAKDLAEKGWLSLSWPKEYGGQGRSTIDYFIFKEVTEYYGTMGVEFWGVTMVAPAILVHGTEEQKKRFLPPIAKGEAIWCEGFSEPNTGSDLASVSTKATLENDQWVINGEKIWTSGAHRANWIFVLARTDPNVPKHKGVTYFLVDMKSPGITVQRIPDMTGEHHLNHVYFDNVKVPRENVLGGVNKGFYVAMTTLDFERSGIERIGRCQRFLDRTIKWVKEQGLDSDPVIRNRLARMATEIHVGRLLCYRIAWLQNKGEVPTTETSISKVYGAELMQRVGRTIMEILGPYGILSLESELAPMNGAISFWHVSNVGRTFGAGTSEIQRNVIATRGLGLPRE
ncbi:MAG: acyl-CoA dehydrogenase family protein [Chloroflexi bacterium]|nr:acyl-CoA dehydrogenase family protein [Chloroflexota bacterium]